VDTLFDLKQGRSRHDERALEIALLMRLCQQVARVLGHMLERANDRVILLGQVEQRLRLVVDQGLKLQEDGLDCAERTARRLQRGLERVNGAYTCNGVVIDLRQRDVGGLNLIEDIVDGRHLDSPR
jgi:hypothetical protein